MNMCSARLWCAIQSIPPSSKQHYHSKAHFQSLLVDLEDTAATTDTPFPFTFSEADYERIKLDSDNAAAGTELVAEVRASMGDLRPDKGLIEHG